MQTEIIPAILEKSFPKIKKLIEKSKEGGAKLVQIDICDGRLTPSKTFASSSFLESFKKIKDLSIKINYELDLIIDMENGPKGRGDKFLDSIKFLKPKRVIFHFSGVKDWDKIFNTLKNSKIEIGLGIWLTDDNKKVKKLLEEYHFDYIQIMGIEKVGFGGQKLSKKVFTKVKYFKKNFPDLPIQIDGGVKLENSLALKKVGVSRFVSGSGIFGADNIKKRINEFKKELA